MIFSKQQKQNMDSVFNEYNAQFAYVFGSFVCGNNTKNSDIDIAVYLNNNFSVKKRFQIRLKLAAELAKILKKEVDLTIINDISSIFFKFTIIKEGKLFYTNNENLRVDVECRILSEYFDFKPFLNEYHKNFINNKIYA